MPRPRLLRSRSAGLTAIVVGLLVFASVSTDEFVSAANFRAILASMAILGVIAAGMTCITIAGGLFSLTLGTTVVVTTMLFLTSLRFGVPAAIAISIAAGALICAIQGLLVGGLDANPIVVTLGFGALQLGIAGDLTNDETVYPPTGTDLQLITDTVLGIPMSVFILLGLVVVIEAWFRTTRLGQETFLVGENHVAARAAALRVTWVMVVAFAIAGGCAGVAAVLIGAVEGNATLLSGGDRYTFDAIAAVLVGGTAAAGGRGSAGRTVLGALVMAAVSDILLLRGYSQGVQALATGAVVLLVIITTQLRRGPA